MAGSSASRSWPKKLRANAGRAAGVARHPRVEQLDRAVAGGRARVAGPEGAHPALPEDVVAAEHLVGALARHHDLVAVVPHQPRQQEQRRGRGAQHGRLGVPHHLGEDLGDVGGGDGDLLVLGAELGHHLLLVDPFVELRVGEPQREGVQRRLGVPRDHRGGDRGVDASGEVGADGYVAAHEPQPGRLDEALAQLGGVGLDVLPRLGAPVGEVDAPVGVAPEAVAVQHRDVAGLELLDAGEHRAGGHRRPVGEHLVEPDGVEGTRHGRVGHQRLDLGGEGDPVPVTRVEERAHAEAVAREHEPVLARVPQGQRPLAVEAGEALLAPLLPGVHDDLGVARGAEAVAAAAQLLAAARRS